MHHIVNQLVSKGVTFGGRLRATPSHNVALPKASFACVLFYAFGVDRIAVEKAQSIDCFTLGFLFMEFHSTPRKGHCPLPLCFGYVKPQR